MKKESKSSVISKLRSLQVDVKANSENYTSHLLIGVDQDEDGFPQSSLTMSTGKPMELIGMVDTIIDQLKDIKKNIIKNITVQSKKSKHNFEMNDGMFEKMTNSLPPELAEKIKDFKKRMDQAVSEGDDQKLRALRDEISKMRNPFSSKDSDDNDDEPENFDINDFKGGIA